MALRGRRLALDVSSTRVLAEINVEKILAAATAAGVDLSALATTLQIEGRDSFNKSWTDLLAKISAKREALAAAR